jgi:maleylacetoacetate isomerase
MPPMRTLYSYWRSSAAYRVRIALNLKGMDYAIAPVHLLRDGGEQHHEEYRRLNPQQLVPVLVDGGKAIHESLAIIEYLEEAYPDHPRVMPRGALACARVRALAQMIACDIHPIGNLRVLQYLGRELAAGDEQKLAWSRHWIKLGFDAIEKVLVERESPWVFCEGNQPTMADCCLIPQVYNARRFGVPLEAYPTIARIDALCRGMEVFARAAPDAQPDAQPDAPAV